MSKLTKNLNLYLTDMETDGNDYFDFERDLNQNWDKLDEAFGKIKSNIPFCVNSAAVDKNGNPAFLSLENNIITAIAPFTYTTAEGKICDVTENLTLDISSLDLTKNYNIFVDPQNGLSASSAGLYIQKNEPQNPQEGDIWYNISVSPAPAYSRNQSGWAKTQKVPIALLCVNF